MKPAASQPSPAPPFKRRAGQVAFIEDQMAHRIMALIARRQYGKTTIASDISVMKMMAIRGHDVVFGSVKLDLGREMIRKEGAQLQKAFAEQARRVRAAKMLLETTDDRGKTLAEIKDDDFAELYEASRLEFRLWHDRTTYSRTKVVALTPEAVGETGDLILDEVGRVRKFRDVWEAVKPFISSNPLLRILLTTTPPPDDTHYSFELLSPPVGFDPPPKPEGNLYKSDLGIWVRRITAYDAYANKVPLYDDDTGAAISPEESRRRDPDRDAWDRNYGCKFVFGGTGACSGLALDTAQQRGIGECSLITCYTSPRVGRGKALTVVDRDGDFDAGLRWLEKNIGNNQVGLGWDLATTTKQTSNPSAFAVCERYGMEMIVRAVFIWKTADPDVALDRARRIVETVRRRTNGGRARRLCVDATNEQYFAARVKRELLHELPVELIVASVTVEAPGQDGTITMKQLLGGRLVNDLDDNHLWLPPERYLRDDWRLVKKEKGAFVCEPDIDGKHGDTFDAAKLARHALFGSGGPAEAQAVQVGGWRNKTTQDQGGWKNQRPYGVGASKGGGVLG